jgi:predicted nuclease of predicted toxin-antitoxin system
MGVDQRVVQWLRARGHEVAHLRDEGLHGMPDEGIFAKAIAEKRVVLTFDLDFGEIAALTKGKVASVVLFRLHNTRAAHVIQRLEAVLTTGVDALDAGAVVIVEESRHRVRPLPIGRSLPGT